MLKTNKAFKDAILFFSLFVFVNVIFAQSTNDVRMAYINVYDNGDTIPTEFLERARDDGYNYIQVAMMPWNQRLAGVGAWNNGRYNNGNFSNGLLFENIRDLFQLVDSYGMKMIPEIQISTPEANWVETGNTVMENCTVIGKDTLSVPVLAPDNRTNGFGRTFQDVMEVVDEAYHAANIQDTSLDYIMLVYDESIQDRNLHPNFHTFWGNGTRDISWMANNGGSLSDLVAASIEEKIDIMHNNVGRHLETTKMMTWASMFEPEGYQVVIPVNERTIDVPQSVANLGIEDDVIFVQWWYSISSFGQEYNVLNALQHLGAHGSKVAYCCETWDKNDTLPFNNEHLISMGRTITAANSPEVRDFIIGYKSGHYVSEGYQDGSDIRWKSMEYMSNWTTNYPCLY